uniref:Delta-like protein n=1 Tax=Kryptolebias marmoratus TaxID=37003 RepID=A0A3Q3BPV0_KRYMA
MFFWQTEARKQSHNVVALFLCLCLKQAKKSPNTHFLAHTYLTLLLLDSQEVLLTLICVCVCDVGAAGVFELQIRHFQNPHGHLQSGKCCDLRAGGGQRCSARDQCDTFFHACLKEYQARVIPTGACTFGSDSTGVLGGNSQSLRNRGNDGGGGGEDGTNGHIAIPFKFAWPKSFSLVLEALDYDNDTSEPGQLIERVLLSSMLNPGEQWQKFHHHGRVLTLEYRLRFRCDANYYGPFCNKFCRARDDFFGHFSCDPSGFKVCMEGWTGPECKEAVCRQGCHQAHGSCTVPGECKCHYGWTGPFCDQCETFPGCVYGSCTEPWQCVCDVNWGGLLCNKDLNYCGTHQPCKNGGTCTNTEPNEYQCECQEGFRGRNCDIDANECEASVCIHARSCRNLIGGYLCDCLPGWTGPNCDISTSCQGLCLNGGRCEVRHVKLEKKNTLLLSGSRCSCPPGFSGKFCQSGPGPCDSAPCLHGGQCTVEQDGRTAACNCPTGRSGLLCAVSDTTHGGLSFYMILVGVLALVMVCGCAACAFTFSHLHRKRRKQQSVPPEEGINNQREFVTLIRNVDRAVPLVPPAAPAAQPPAPAPAPRCYEEIELTLPPSPAPSHPSPALKPAHAPKLDISNREREKLNRFHYTDNQELEV